jgi:murein DD-endopeptidase MepM/ murein hydrolase activator NlpD
MTFHAGWARACRRGRALQERWFPPRQIVVREADRAIAVSLRPGFQIAVAAAFAVGVVWSAGATVGYLVNWGGAALAHAETDRLRAGYGQLIDEVSRQHSKVLDITQDLEHYRSYLLTLLEQNGNQADGTEGEPQRTAAATQALRGQLDDLARDLVGLNQRNEVLESDVSELRHATLEGDDEPERFAAARAILDRRLARLEQDASGAANRTQELERTLAAKQQLVDEAQTARRQAIHERDALSAKFADAEQRIKTMTSAHDQALAQLSEETRSTITEVERIVNSVGLDTKRLVPLRADARRQNRGGPFIPWSAYRADPGPRSEATTQTLHSDIARLDDLRQLLRVLPLASPIKQEFSITSTFGYRVDPFNNLAAFHTGVDLQAPLRTPVVAPAAGKVVFAGWHASYGRMVEVDHGYGIRTRYAHLDRIAVHEGEDVSAGVQLGLLGATGRTSAQHLHYEILVDGRPRNPMSFLRATADVRKNR